MHTWVLYDTWRFVKRLGRMREKFSRVKLFGKWVDASIAAAAPRTQFADAAAYASNFLKSKFQWQSRLGGIILVCSREKLTLNKNSIVIKLRLIPNLFPT